MAPKKKAAAEHSAPTETQSPTNKQHLRIIGMQIDNVKRISCVRLFPKRNVMQITGENGEGKSTILDSIEYALRGTSNLPSHPIKKGAPSGRIQVDLGDYKITRRFHTHGGGTTDLVIEGKNREVFKSPQQLLDSLMGKISFDPLEFIRMKPAQQLEELKKLVGADLDAIDAAKKTAYEFRREAGRVIDALKARLTSTPEVDIAAIGDGQFLDLSTINARFQEAIDINKEIEVHTRNAFDLKNRADQLRTQANNARTRIQQLQAEIDQLKKAQEADDFTALAQETEAAAIESKLPKLIDTAKFAEEMAEANAINDNIRKFNARQTITDELAAEEKVWETYDAEYKSLDKTRVEAIAAAKLPVDKLTFGDGEVLFDELPLDQASSAEQIRVSVALGMATNPTIRVLRIKDGSLLDDKSMKVIEEMAESNDFQVWIERVDSSGKVGIVMHDGEASGEGAEKV